MLNFRFLAFGFLTVIIPSTIHAGWSRTFGGEYKDDAFCVQLASDNSYVMLGSTESFPEDLQGYNAWFLKIDEEGDTLWTRTFGGTYTDYGRWLEKTNDGGYIIVGSTVSFHLNSFGLWLIKTNQDGDTMWSKSYLEEEYNIGRCVQQTIDGGYIAVGSIGTINDALIIKTDENGDTMWTRRYGGDSEDYAYFVRQTMDEKYIVAGTTQSFGDGVADVWLLKLDEFGDTIWTRTYGGEGYDNGSCVQETMDKGFVITGDIGSSLWLFKTDSLGNELWSKVYGLIGYSGGGHVEELEDGGFIVVGSIDYDLWLLRTDSLGDTVWTRTYGGYDLEGGRCVKQTDDKGFIVAGITYTYGNGESDMWLLKLDSQGLLAVDEEPPVTHHSDLTILVSVGNQIVLHYSNCPQGFSVSIFDASGRKVDEINSVTQSGIILWGDGHEPGVYFIKPEDDNQQSAQKVILLR